MVQPSENNYQTVTVMGSKLVAHDKSTALLLRTRELGSIAFEVDLAAIATIRQSLDLAEKLILALPGNSQVLPS